MDCEFSPVSVVLLPVLLQVPTLSIMGCAAQDAAGREQRPFFQEERETDTHGRKNWLDRLVELDPGKLQVEMASDSRITRPQ